MMTEISKNDTLQMFFDEEFDPVSYVDALFQSISGSSDRYSQQNLSKLSSTTQDLLTHLEYNTTVFVKEIEKKLDQLEKSSSVIGSSYGLVDGPTGSEKSETSRLEYYIDSLNNAVETLAVDIDSIRRTSNVNTGNEVSGAEGVNPIESLLSLEQVKKSILSVYHIIQKAKKKVGGVSDQVISDEQFSAALSQLHDELKYKLRESGPDSDVRAEIVATVKDLRSWVPMFQPFTKFGPTFVKFVVRLESEL